MRGIAITALVLALMAQTAHAKTDLTTNDRLKDRREVTAGTRAYSVGFQDGRFYANGWHITGEMGGVWAPPLKLADGVWFGVDDDWVPPATGFTSGRGYVRYALPTMKSLLLRRTDFVPDGRRAALFGLELANPQTAPVTVTVKVDVHSELLGAYPWTDTTPSAKSNLSDIAAFENGGLTFVDRGTPTGGEPHDYTALVASTRTPEAGETGPNHRGPQPGAVCRATDTSAPSLCDDSELGKGTGGQLRYRVTVMPRTKETVWVAVAGSDRGVDDARKELAAALKDPDAQLDRKIAARNELAGRSAVSLPGDRRLQEALDWGKQNLADLTQTATSLNVRFVDQGKALPAPVHRVKRATFIGAGYPDYPWLFATDGEYTAFAAVALGQFEAIKQHLSALREVSDAVNARSGKVVHETVTDGSVYFGANADPGNTDETAKFPSAVALVWRWTGDNRFRDRMYDFSRRALRYVTTQLDADHDRWPEGNGNVEREGMGEEALDSTVYLIRGLEDFAELARAKGEAKDAQWARDIASRMRARFDKTWWNGTQYADSLKAGERQQQGYWTGVTPMETGLAPADHGVTALKGREDPCYSGVAGLFHTGCTERIAYSLTNAVAAVAEANYGRSAKRFTSANARAMLDPDEMPGALPETLPSPDQGENVGRCWTCRSMFMQAWGQYGIAWPVIAQQLGVRPELGTGRLDVVPSTRISARNVRLGTGAIDVAATRTATTVTVGKLKLKVLRIGKVLPAGTRLRQVTLDGERVRKPTVRTTPQGVEVTVRAPASGRHTVVVNGP
ncbi:MAG TPA: hypothetical protein VNS09_05775 [Solirubrobacter sp.]|nr:hypothetical protein [Solirubrobacter sp.]